mmetsp:Transcript_39877/g.87031  ORF Transcript_39877/g.87031 Transcript_39877/m.87031 type:complete len:216 (-) Transcript_39877:1003-1650(-)
MIILPCRSMHVLRRLQLKFRGKPKSHVDVSWANDWSQRWINWKQLLLGSSLDLLLHTCSGGLNLHSHLRQHSTRISASYDHRPEPLEEEVCVRNGNHFLLLLHRLLLGLPLQLQVPGNAISIIASWNDVGEHILEKGDGEEEEGHGEIAIDHLACKECVPDWPVGIILESAWTGHDHDDERCHTEDEADQVIPQKILHIAPLHMSQAACVMTELL